MVQHQRLCQLERAAPVSYTHLDVYKRQILSSVVFPAAVDAQYMPEPGSTLIVPTGNPKYDPNKQIYEPPRCKSGKGDPSSRTYLPIADRGHSDPQNTGSYCIHLGLTAEKRDGAKNTQSEPPCAETYAEWLDNPHLDFWVEDPEVTSLGCLLYTSHFRQPWFGNKYYLNWSF